MTQAQALALGLVEHHTTGGGRWIQPVQTPLQSLLPSYESTLSHKLVLPVNLLRMYLISLSRPLTRVSNRTGPKTEPWNIPLVTLRQLDLTSFPTALWVWPHSPFFTQLHLSKPWAAASPGEYCGKACQRLYSGLGRHIHCLSLIH